jgi:nucleotide-binding universal stress UspA family protein
MVRTVRARPISPKRVLVATDFSSTAHIALSHALALSRRYGAKIYLAHMISPELFRSVPREVRTEARKRTREHAHHEMSALVRLAELRKFPHQTVIEEGNVAVGVLRLVREHAIDLLVIGTHGRRGVKRMLLGSVAEKLFRQSPCPVLIVPPRVSEHAGIDRIVYPTDFSKHSLQVAPHALSLARRYRAKLILLHVVQGTAVHSLEELTRQRKQVETRMRRSFPGKSNLEQQPVVEVEFGDAAQKIRKVAAEWQSDLIVLGVRRAKSTVAHLAEGTAYQVVRQAPCPVLTIRGPRAAASRR